MPARVQTSFVFLSFDAASYLHYLVLLLLLLRLLPGFSNYSFFGPLLACFALLALCDNIT